jgi:hypothetical protein
MPMVNIQPVFTTEVLSVKKENDQWNTGTSRDLSIKVCDSGDSLNHTLKYLI